jgi:hypothetical protein
MSNEYIFFDETLRDRFMGFASKRGISGQSRPDPIEGFVVELPDGLPDDVESAIELEYDLLMDLQRGLVDAAEGEDGQDVLGIAVTLPDGRDIQVRLPGAYGRRLAQHFSFEEIHELVTVIAHSAANPVAGPLCHKN